MKEEIVNFLFWLQYLENKDLLEDWLHSNASNRFIAQSYLDSLEVNND